MCAYHSITKKLLAFHDHQFATLVFFESPLQDNINYADLWDFVEELWQAFPTSPLPDFQTLTMQRV